MTIIATAIVLGVLIFVHELGHFWAAKAVGIEVERFSIGLGPKVFGFTRGETEWVICALPLGGYVKMGGMDDEAQKIEGGELMDSVEALCRHRSTFRLEADLGSGLSTFRLGRDEHAVCPGSVHVLGRYVLRTSL